MNKKYSKLAIYLHIILFVYTFHQIKKKKNKKNSRKWLQRIQKLLLLYTNTYSLVFVSFFVSPKDTKKISK